jgi:hypothetical protein
VCSETGEVHDRKPAGPPSLVRAQPGGYGLHPQTWQGWLITVAFVIVVILIVALTR